MPMKSKKKSYKKKASTSWLTQYKPRARTVYKPNVGIGRSLFTKLRTTFFANVTHAASGIFTGYLNPGSCFDPTGDISTVQPAGFDQLATLYARYLVTGCTVDIEVMASKQDTSNGGAGTDTSVIAVYPSTVSTALGTYQGAASQPYAKTAMYGPVKCGKLRFKLNTQQVVGSRLPVIAEDCGALVGASPTTGQNMILPMFLQHSAAAAGQTSIIKVTIIQDVIFDQRIQVVDA